jgi:hypothetical protein
MEDTRMPQNDTTLGTFASGVADTLTKHGERIAEIGKAQDLMQTDRTRCNQAHTKAQEELELRMRKVEIDIALVSQRVAIWAAVGAGASALVVQGLFKLLG